MGKKKKGHSPGPFGRAASFPTDPPASLQRRHTVATVRNDNSPLHSPPGSPSAYDMEQARKAAERDFNATKRKDKAELKKLTRALSADDVQLHAAPQSPADPTELPEAQQLTVRALQDDSDAMLALAALIRRDGLDLLYQPSGDAAPFNRIQLAAGCAEQPVLRLPPRCE